MIKWLQRKTLAFVKGHPAYCTIENENRALRRSVERLGEQIKALETRVRMFSPDSGPTRAHNEVVKLLIGFSKESSKLREIYGRDMLVEIAKAMHLNLDLT